MNKQIPEIPLPYNVSFEIVGGEVVISLNDFYSYLDKLELSYYRIAQHPSHDDDDERAQREAGAKVAANTISFLEKRFRHVFTEENIRKYSKQKENL